MAIQVICPGCDKTLTAPAEMAGKQARCPHCRMAVQVPAAPAEEEAGYSLLEPPPPRPSFIKVEPSPPMRGPSAALQAERSAKKKTGALENAGRSGSDFTPAETDAAEQPAGAAPKRLPRYWWFALTLVPLAISLLSSHESALERFERTIEAHPELLEKVLAAKNPVSALISQLPESKFEGAHLARSSWLHWLYGLAAAALFYFLIMALFERGEANSLHVLVVGATTATVGIFMLLAFQWFADVTQNVWLRGRGIAVALFYLVKLIGFSYRAALDPSNGFLSSFFGFTLGVGLCEEFTKAAPVFFKLRDSDGDGLSWRAACIWGLASGAGFGIAEGILYASDQYNGIATYGIYPVRFISCVGLHAIWTAAVALMIWHNQELLSGEMDWGDWILALLKVQGIPMVLHGLYDTLLKRDMNAAALVTAAASFAWLAFLISRSYASEQPRKKRAKQIVSPA